MLVSKKIKIFFNSSLGQSVHWIGAHFCLFMLLDSRDKSLNLLKFCLNHESERNNKKKNKSGKIHSLVLQQFYNKGTTLFFGMIRKKLETWPVKKGDLARLSSFETRCARRFVYNGFEIAIQELLRKAQLDSPKDYVLRRMRLKWCGHVFRMPDERVTKEALFFEKAPTWKRPRGGVRRTWRSTVAADLERVLKPPNMRADKWRLCWKDACMEAALDRKRWRAIVRDSICG